MLLSGYFLDAGSAEAEKWDNINQYLACRSEQYITSNQEVYMLLPERPYFDIIFELFKLVRKEQTTARETTLQVFRLFTQMTRNGGFKRRYIRMALGKPRQEDLLESIGTVLRREDTMNVAE